LLAAALLVCAAAAWGQGYPLPALGTSLADIKKAYSGLEKATDPASLEAAKKKWGADDFYKVNGCVHDPITKLTTMKWLLVGFKHGKLAVVLTAFSVHDDETNFLSAVSESVTAIERFVGEGKLTFHSRELPDRYYSFKSVESTCSVKNSKNNVEATVVITTHPHVFQGGFSSGYFIATYKLIEQSE
jgi:hypothetical protein